MKVVVIGAGISGLSAARILEEKGVKCVVYEGSNKPGGLVRCDRIEGNLFHKVGGHVFNAKDKRVSDWFWSYFNKETEFLKAERNAKIQLQGKIIGYPIENHLYSLDQDCVEKVIHDLLQIGDSAAIDPFSYPNFEAFLLGNFGATLYDLYFKPYNTKIWRSDLSKIPMHWLDGKLPMPDLKKIVISNIIRAGEREMIHSTFYYPVKNGSQFIVDRLAEGLNIRTEAMVTALEYISGKWKVNGDGSYDAVIYTGDIRRLGTILKKPSQEASHIIELLVSLPSNATSNMLCYTDPTDLSWLYIPDPDIRAHRIIYTGNFSSSNNVEGERRNCVVEFSGKADEATMREELKKLPGNLTPIAVNYEPNSYVIQQKDTRTQITRLKELLQTDSFFLTGRFAEWEYHNMDKAIENSMKVSGQIV